MLPNINLLRKHTPRWVIFAIDLLICLFSISLAYLLRFNFNIPEIELKALWHVVPLVMAVRALSFLLGRTYAGIVRYTSSKDAERIFLVITLGSLFFILLNFIYYYNVEKIYLVPFSIIIIEFITSIFILTASRLLVKILYLEFNHPRKERNNVIIFGTDQSAIITKKTIDGNEQDRLRVVAFIENTRRNVRKKLEGVSIYHTDQLESILRKYEVSRLIIAKAQIPQNRKAQIIETCLNHNVTVLTVPPPNKWINGELSFHQIKNIKIEELLGREPILLGEKEIRKQIINKTILVTGAAGSIGSEMVRQIINYQPKLIILFDQAESPLYDLEMELREQHKYNNYEIVIGNIANLDSIEPVFKKFKPQIVFHAAAYKHVPMMERHPVAAVQTNILGTKLLADLSILHGVASFVMVSTDKAVNPTNVMGASKRIAEIYCQTASKNSSTKFTTTRFGNVLGSNGSVIPRFRKQIEEGGPITITHPDITRYFMTIPEACQLVLEASTIGKGGEVFIFDMGKSVKIIDLAKKMLKLSGLTLGKDIQMIYTGLRPGEKLFEELLNDEENTGPTPHEKIMIAKVVEYDEKYVKEAVENIISCIGKCDNYEIVRKMKEIVPEFISKNSIYEEIDIEKNGHSAN